MLTIFIVVSGIALLENLIVFVFGEPVDYWPVVGKFAETVESSYLDMQHRLLEEAETLSAFAGLSVMSATSSSHIDFIQCVYLFAIIKSYT